MPRDTADLRHLAKELKSLPRRFVEDAATTIAKAATKVLTTDTGGDRSLSGARGKISVTKTIKGHDIVSATIAPAKKNAGQYVWLEEGTRSHRIGGGRHPGTRAKRTWSRAVEPAVKALSKDMDRRFRELMR